MTTTPDPLDMAANCAAHIAAYAKAQTEDPLAAYNARLGTRGHITAQLAGDLALVAIAADMRRIADHLTGPGRAEP